MNIFTIEDLRTTWGLPMIEFRRRLILKGIMPDQVDEKIKIIPDATERALALNSWGYEASVRRMSPLVLQFAPMFNMDESALDELFHP